eukprot:TRINITY_DN6950_c0_g1_i1.p1 TRINITY_DN6950_c0_g1~~TRINITY_DN6950_c0_g1_i1.p1  ORF type:complete len:973 (-),score=205.08 TRINITY_DN6950_c0_g1_i1:162-3080(-)
MRVFVTCGALVLVMATMVVGQARPKQMTIAAIFDQGGDPKHELAFNHAVQSINRNRDILTGVELTSEIVHIPEGDSYMAERKTCYLLEKGVVAIFGPLSKPSSEHIKSITDSMEIPYIETRWNFRSQKVIGQAGDYAINLHPDITTLGAAYLDLIETYQWKAITILYQDNDSMMTLKQIFDRTSTVGPMDEFRLVIKQLDHNENGYRDVLKEIFFSESNLIVLDCEKKILDEVLKQAQQVGLISQGYFFLLTSLDAHTVNLEDYKYGGTNFTAFRLIDVDKPEVQNVIYSIVESMIDKELRMAINVPEGNLDTTTALIYDSVHAFALALNELSEVQQVRQRPLDCAGQATWVHGNSLINYMKMVEFIGLSGPIKFDTSGLRTQFAMDLMELQMTGLTKVGTWNTLDRLGVARAEEEKLDGGAPDPMANKTFVICAVLNPPYTMYVESFEKLSGNARFEGFALDLAEGLSKILGFNYTFKLVDDGSYGSETSPGNWNGMLGEVHDGIADFVIADISITSSRANAFAFSIPWLNLGISILYIKPRPAAPSLIAFLDPFTPDVYIYTMLVFVVTSLCLYVLARFSPNQWEDPGDPTDEFTNCFTMLGSFWFTLGAFLGQGSDLTCICINVRFAACFWFFFALIMIASYTANLAAFLTVETLERPIESVQDLANQNEIFYGAVNGGSTAGFFAKSEEDVYQRINQFMRGVHQSEVMLNSNTEGVEKVEETDGKYAFFMESASIQYLVERRCKLSQVGGLLDSKGYGIASRKGTPYKDLLDYAILKLMEGGTLHKLRIKWWKQKRGGGACQSAGGGGGVSPLGLSSVAGVFLVTMLGCGIATVFAIIEFLYGTRQAANEAGVSWVEEMTHELKFIFQCHGNTKKLRNQSSDSDSNKSGNSQSSHLSLDESPPYSRKKSTNSRNGSIYKNNIGMVESPYEVKSEHSHKTQDDESEHPGSGSDEGSNKNGNPFETMDDD